MYEKKYHEQTLDCYRNSKYGGGTIYTSGCGPSSLANALDFLGIGSYTVKNIADFALSCGARVEGGTSMPVLLRHAAGKYGFTYEMTSKNAELLAHLKKGGVAIINNGSRYQLFSSGGHYVCAFGIANDGRILIADSYWYSGKYSQNSIRRAYVMVIEHGIVKTSLEQCGKASIDRSPSYYLIGKKPTQFKVKVTENCPIRMRATKKSCQTGTQKKDDVITITDKTENWYRRKVGGWIAKKYCKKL